MVGSGDNFGEETGAGVTVAAGVDDEEIVEDVGLLMEVMEVEESGVVVAVVVAHGDIK